MRTVSFPSPPFCSLPRSGPCRSAPSRAAPASTTVSAEAKPEPLAITTATVEERPIDRFLRVTGSLLADEQAEVSAEATGRIVDTPVERGTRVAQGRCSRGSPPRKPSAQLQEAEANAAQIAARLGLAPEQPFDREARAGRHERQGVARLGGSGVRADAVAARPEGGVAERIRPAPHAGRGRPPAVPDGARTRRSSRTARCRRRAPASRWRARRWQTPRCARRSPASSPSAR